MYQEEKRLFGEVLVVGYKHALKIQCICHRFLYFKINFLIFKISQIYFDPTWTFHSCGRRRKWSLHEEIKMRLLLKWFIFWNDDTLKSESNVQPFL